MIIRNILFSTCKTHKVPILMHEMRVSMNYSLQWNSGWKSWKSEILLRLQTAEGNQHTECYIMQYIYFKLSYKTNANWIGFYKSLIIVVPFQFLFVKSWIAVLYYRYFINAVIFVYTYKKITMNPFYFYYVRYLVFLYIERVKSCLVYIDVPWQFFFKCFKSS